MSTWRLRRAPGRLASSACGRTVDADLIVGQKYPQTGKIAFVDRQMNQQTGAIRIAAAFANPGRLRPGQFGRITAETEVRHGSILVPQIAVQELQGMHQVDEWARTIECTW